MIPVPLRRKLRPGIPRHHRPERARLPLELAAAVLWIDKVRDAAQAGFAIGLITYTTNGAISSAAHCRTWG